MAGPFTIESVKANKVFNSRGSLTVEVEVYTKNSFGRAIAPGGASTGSHEARPYPGGGVEGAVKNLKEVVIPKLIGLDVEKQEEIDQLLHDIDGTDCYVRIGGNAVMAISLAIAKAAASSKNIPFFRYLSGETPVALPYPLGNVLGGGKHAGGGAPDIQEFLILPFNVSSFSEAVSVNIAVHERLRILLQKNDTTFTGGKGDEGAWAPNLANDEALSIVTEAVESVKKELGVEIGVGLDMAASTLWDEEQGSYVYRRDGVKRDSGDQIDYVLNLIRKFRLIYVEDPLQEEDFDGFTEITKKVNSCFICGDDLFTTNSTRLRKGIALKSGNAIIIKPNQIGTITETLKTIKLANRTQYVPVASHRSGETCDTYLAHLAVGLDCPIIKVGIVGGERIAKINELLRIERILGEGVELAKLKV